MNFAYIHDILIYGIPLVSELYYDQIYADHYRFIAHDESHIRSTKRLLIDYPCLYQVYEVLHSLNIQMADWVLFKMIHEYLAPLFTRERLFLYILDYIKNFKQLSRPEDPLERFREIRFSDITLDDINEFEMPEESSYDSEEIEESSYDSEESEETEELSYYSEMPEESSYDSEESSYDSEESEASEASKESEEEDSSELHQEYLKHKVYIRRSKEIEYHNFTVDTIVDLGLEDLVIKNGIIDGQKLYQYLYKEITALLDRPDVADALKLCPGFE